MGGDLGTDKNTVSLISDTMQGVRVNDIDNFFWVSTISMFFFL